MSDPFKHPHRVSYAECTLGNHVYYARYLDILEEARGEFFRHMGEPLQKWQEQSLMFPVAEAQVKFKGAARYDDLIEIRVKLVQITRIRLQFEYEIHLQNKVLIEATISHVCTDLDEKPKRMPVELSEKLQRFAQDYPKLGQDSPACGTVPSGASPDDFSCKHRPLP